MKRLDLTNRKFGKLLVIRKAKNQKHKTMWECKCDCGKITFVTTSNLTCNKIKSCGCLKNEKLIQRNSLHKQRHTNLYEVWKTMKQRCYNPKNLSYKNYGGRGIFVCDDWKNNFISFYNWSISNGYVKGLTIDRIDNNGNYCPENCRWVDRVLQANNTRFNKHITINGKDDTLSNWLKYYNITRNKYYNRIKKGFSEQEALTIC